MTHPSSIDLEAFAVGEQLPTHFAAHLEECAACAEFVEQLRALVAGGPSAAESDDVVARAVARGTGGSREDTEAANDVVAPNAGRARQEPKRKLWVLATSVITPLAAAAAIVLLARSQPEANVEPPPATTTSRIQMAPFPPPVSRSSGSVEPDTQFKGGPQVAVVRERAGQQARFSSAVKVRPGDRIRVEVALDREQAILGGVLGDDGTYLELMPEAVRGPGTHFSEKSAKFDASETHVTILIGTADAVARARATRKLDDISRLTTVRIEWESP
jgi:hypothetical protein